MAAEALTAGVDHVAPVAYVAAPEVAPLADPTAAPAAHEVGFNGWWQHTRTGGVHCVTVGKRTDRGSRV